MADYRCTSAQELLTNTKVPIKVVENDIDVVHDMVYVMLEEIRKNNALGKKTVFIVPVGPVGQYKRFASIAMHEQLDLSNLYIINMDEYLTDDGEWIAYDHPLSFRGFMDHDFYDLLTGPCFIPEDHRIFPTPGKEEEIQKKIDELGGVDIAFGGIGIMGHIAFNEALDEEEEMSNEDFANLPTRVLNLTKETRTINSVTGLGGYIDGIPKKCITIGMKEILGARKLRFYMNREWHRGIIRKICLGPVTGHVPASFFQNHPDALLTMAEHVTYPPSGLLR